MSAVSLASVSLVAGGDRRLRTGHPWAYSNEIRMDAQAKAIAPGSLVLLRRIDGKPLAVGSFNPHALIAFRRFAAPDATIDADWLAATIGRALALRERLYAEPFYRLIHAEADGLPGLIVDRYGDALVAQVNTAGMERLLPTTLAALESTLAPAMILLRNDSPYRALEGLSAEARIAKGALDGPIEGREGDIRFIADLASGQKTGWFYDQRDNRAFVARLARDARVLDAYCHSGGFAIAALRAGARAAHLIDGSTTALDLARRTAAMNGVAERCAFVHDDVFAALGRLGAAGERFDVVIADPPAFVKSRKDLKTGAKGYRKLARLAAALTAPRGFLFIASCSHNMDAEGFASEVAAGLERAGRSGRIIRAAGAGPDHPVHPSLPETAYLKTLTIALD